MQYGFSVNYLTHITQLHKRKFTEALTYYSLTRHQIQKMIKQ